MSKDEDTRVVAVYLRGYLSISMTFVYRQLRGVAPRYRPVVLTSSASNLHVFPTDPLCNRDRTFFDRIQIRLERILSGRYATLSAAFRDHWMLECQQRGVQLIHAHFGQYGMEILPVARDLKIPLLVTFHGVDGSILLRNARFVKQLTELSAYARIIAISHGMADRLVAAGVERSRIIVHYIGTPVDTFAWVERTPPVEKVKNGHVIDILQVSNFVEVKGHRYTIEAFARLLDRYANCRLTFAGDGPTRPEMEALCRQRGVEDHVSFVGRQTTEQVVKLMADADIFVQHSVTLDNGIQEGLPTVIAEAMSTGLVVVTSRHSAIPEIVEDDVNGFLVEERDVDGYVATLARALESTEETGRRAADKIRADYNMNVQNERLVEIYDRMVSGESWS